ncbi:MAG: PAS domain-containing sensor histidine kinase [Candidatus Obscuribacterales bacterium]|nr:PAS domain-containing sensor histidine kinase [Candidatus Obscuribacterales bacterium]
MKRKEFQLTLFHKALILIAVPLAFELILLSSLYGLLQHAEKEAFRAEHAKTVIAKTTEVVQLLFDAGVTFVAYDAASKPLFEKRLMQIFERIPAELANLEVLVENNKSYSMLVLKVRKESSEAISELLTEKRDLDRGGRLNIMVALRLKEQLNDCVSELGKIIKSEKASQIDPEAAPRLKSLIYMLILFGLIMSVVIAVLLVLIFHAGTSKRLEALMDNSLRMSQREPLAPPLTGNDEIAKLDHAFHYAADVLNEAARKERAVFENAADVICTISGEGQISAVSPAVTEVLGWQPSELTGRKWIEMVAEEDREAALKWSEGLHGKETAHLLENKCIRRDGQTVDMLWSGHWSQKEGSLFCIVHDITKRKELERFKQEFAAMVSHDLRTPLAAVQSTLTVLGRGAWGELSERAQKKVQVAEANIKQSIELINTLLEIDKMESGKLSLDLDDVSLLPLVRRCAEAVAALSERKQITLKLPTKGVEVMADPDRLAQVIMNLMGNAIKFSPEKSTITLTIESDDEHVTVFVTDEGPGIPEDVQQTIFDRYHQLDGDLKKKKEGSGLGLAICKAIVDAHRGTIGVTSVDGHGSSFWFRIPLEQPLPQA